MLTFRLTKQNFARNTFIAKKSTPISKTLNDFGFITSIDKRGVLFVTWYNNYIREDIVIPLRRYNDFKSIYPYFNTPFVRGNIWKHSYNTLLNKIHLDTGFSKIKVDKVTYKKKPIKGNDVIINDAIYLKRNNISLDDIDGKIVNSLNGQYNIRTNNGHVHLVPRNSFMLLPQDDFILLSIRCN